MKRLALTALPLLTACMSMPPSPSPAYRALGTEPFWSLSIDSRNLVFSRPDAQAVVQPRPRVIIGIAGEIYQTPRINVNIVHGQCTLRGQTYPDKVQVYVDGTQHEGCGGL